MEVAHCFHSPTNCKVSRYCQCVALNPIVHSFLPFCDFAVNVVRMMPDHRQLRVSCRTFETQRSSVSRVRCFDSSSIRRVSRCCMHSVEILTFDSYLPFCSATARTCLVIRLAIYVS